MEGIPLTTRQMVIYAVANMLIAGVTMTCIFTFEGKKQTLPTQERIQYVEIEKEKETVSKEIKIKEFTIDIYKKQTAQLKKELAELKRNVIAPPDAHELPGTHDDENERVLDSVQINIISKQDKVIASLETENKLLSSVILDKDVIIAAQNKQINMLTEDQKTMLSKQSKANFINKLEIGGAFLAGNIVGGLAIKIFSIRF